MNNQYCNNVFAARMKVVELPNWGVQTAGLLPLLELQQCPAHNITNKNVNMQILYLGLTKPICTKDIQCMTS